MKKISKYSKIHSFLKRNRLSASVLGYGHFCLSVLMRLAQQLRLNAVARFFFHLCSDQVLEFLEKLLEPVLTCYMGKKEIPEISENSGERIWVCWLQGEESAPPLVKSCINSIRQCSAGREVVVVTHQNRNIYAPLPEYIEEKIQDGTISFTLLSDILRASLLYHQGGIWVDATVLMVRPFPKEWFESVFYSRKIKGDFILNPSLGRWTGYFMAGRKGNVVHGFLYDSFIRYFQCEKIVVDYFLIDYILRIGYDKLTSFRCCVDAVAINNESIDFFLKNSDKRLNKKKYDWALSNAIGFKLTYKREIGKCAGTYGEALLHNVVK